MSDYENASAESEYGDDNEDWVEGGELSAQAEDLTFFGGSSIPIDTSQLPEPDEADLSDPNVA